MNKEDFVDAFLYGEHHVQEGCWYKCIDGMGPKDAYLAGMSALHSIISGHVREGEALRSLMRFHDELQKWNDNGSPILGEVFDPIREIYLAALRNRITPVLLDGIMMLRICECIVRKGEGLDWVENDPYSYFDC